MEPQARDGNAAAWAYFGNGVPGLAILAVGTLNTEGWFVLACRSGLGAASRRIRSRQSTSRFPSCLRRFCTWFRIYKLQTMHSSIVNNAWGFVYETRSSGGESDNLVQILSLNFCSIGIDDTPSSQARCWIKSTRFNVDVPAYRQFQSRRTSGNKKQEQNYDKSKKWNAITIVQLLPILNTWHSSQHNRVAWTSSLDSCASYQRKLQCAL